MERIETGKLEYNFTSLSLDNLVTEAIVANSGYAEEYGVKFLFGKMDADTARPGRRRPPDTGRRKPFVQRRVILTRGRQCRNYRDQGQRNGTRIDRG